MYVGTYTNDIFACKLDPSNGSLSVIKQVRRTIPHVSRWGAHGLVTSLVPGAYPYRFLAVENSPPSCASLLMVRHFVGIRFSRTPRLVSDDHVGTCPGKFVYAALEWGAESVVGPKQESGTDLGSRDFQRIG